MHAEQQSSSADHNQSQPPRNIHHKGTNVIQLPDAIMQVSTPIEVEETDDVGIPENYTKSKKTTFTIQEQTAIANGTNHQNNVQLQQVQTAAKKQTCELYDISIMQQNIMLLHIYNESLKQQLQEQQKKIKGLEEKVDKICTQQKEHHESFERKLSGLQEEIHKIKQEDQKHLTKEKHKLRNQKLHID